MGIGSHDTRVGDKVVVLLGGDVPFILRDEHDGREPLRLIGESYVHGLMNGEAFVPLAKGKRIEEFAKFFSLH